jgi:hypothetical protein
MPAASWLPVGKTLPYPGRVYLTGRVSPAAGGSDDAEVYVLRMPRTASLVTFRKESTVEYCRLADDRVLMPGRPVPRRGMDGPR